MTTPLPETPLDAMIARARELDVRADHARLFVADLERWERRHAAIERRWWPAFVAGLGVSAIVAVVVLLVLGRSASGVTEPVRIGARVAVLGESDTRYSVVELGPDRTVLDLARGSLTARVSAGDPHVVVLRGGGMEVSGSGTISLAVDARGALVAANAGNAQVRRGDDVRSIAAGTTWPDGDAALGRRAAQTLGALDMPAVPSDAPVAPPVQPVPVDITTDAPPAPPPPGPAPIRQVHRDPPPDDAAHADAVGSAQTPPPTAAVTVTERWRSARLFRSQGKFDQAIAECVAIADASDPTWSPIALVEAARIALGPQAAPEQALGFADRFAREWPNNGLASEARDLRCHALAQLGRGAECGVKPGAR